MCPYCTCRTILEILSYCTLAINAYEHKKIFEKYCRFPVAEHDLL